VTLVETNIALDDTPPSVYFDEVKSQCDGGAKKYGGITSMAGFKEHLVEHCIPEAILGPLANDHIGTLDTILLVSNPSARK
jgi:hypothetical protein